jgi:hypothetical protein
MSLALFAAGILVASVARADGFRSYQLAVYCGHSPVATATFWQDVTKPGTMGLKSICAGSCPGGMVPLADALAGLPAEARDGLMAKLVKHEENAAAGKGRSLAVCLNAKCNPDLYADYLRKRQVAMELFQHASDLRLKAVYLIGESMGAEFDNLRFEGEKDLAVEKAWENFGRHVQRGMREARGGLSETWLARKVVQHAPFAANAWNAIGWIDLIVQTTYRGWVTAGEWARYQEEAQTATRQAEESWRKALADFEAHLKQQPACLAESRKAAEEEKNLDRAKQAIEEWENNQVLYRDPINQEALTYDAAIKRAKQLLDSGRISASAWQFIAVANASAGKREPDQQALEAAIKELDTAIASFEYMDKSITAYLRAQYAIEAKLRSAFGAGSAPSQQPAAGKNP